MSKTGTKTEIGYIICKTETLEYIEKQDIKARGDGALGYEPSEPRYFVPENYSNGWPSVEDCLAALKCMNIECFKYTRRPFIRPEEYLISIIKRTVTVTVTEEEIPNSAILVQEILSSEES